MALWLPDWSTDRRRRRDRRDADPRPLTLVARDRQRTIVARCCPRAAQAGVRTGMPLAQARALFAVGGLRAEPHDPGGDRAALERLAVWAHRFAPIVAVDDTEAGHAEPDGLLFDISGCARTWGGEQNGMDRITAALAALGFRVRAAIAPAYAAARAVARFGPDRTSILAPAGVHTAIAPLPVAALGLPVATVRRLAEVGIHHIGELLEIPRRTIPARFGDELLCRLDQAMGAGIETIDRTRPQIPFVVERVFDGPTDRTEAIELTVRGLLDELTEWLRRAGRGARRVEIELKRSDLPPETLSAVLGRPSRDPRHLWGLVRSGLERAHLGFGVEGVRVRVPATGPIHHQQSSYAGPAGYTGCPAGHTCDELFDTLRNRLGDRHVRRPVLRASHLPERAFVLSGAQAEPLGMVDDGPIDRPTLLLDRPEPARVIALTPDGPVHRVAWRGRESVVVGCAGPERIAGEWWRSNAVASTRDYFVVDLDDGRRLWLARSIERGTWFVHGVWA